MKQLGVTDIISVSAVGSLKENLEPGKFIVVDQFIDRTFSRKKLFLMNEIVAHVSMAKPQVNFSNCCEAALKKLKIPYQMGGTYVQWKAHNFPHLQSQIYIDLGKLM